MIKHKIQCPSFLRSCVIDPPLLFVFWRFAEIVLKRIGDATLKNRNVVISEKVENGFQHRVRFSGFFSVFSTFFCLRITNNQRFAQCVFKVPLFICLLTWLSSNSVFAQNYKFSKDRADGYFERCNPKEKFVFICNLMQTDCINMASVDNWINTKIENWSSLLDEVSELDLEYLLHDKKIKISDQFRVPLCYRIIEKWQITKPSKKVLAGAAGFLILNELNVNSTKNIKSWFKILETVLIFNSDAKYKLWYLRLVAIVFQTKGELVKAISTYHEIFRHSDIISNFNSIPPTNYTSKVPGKRSCNLLHG